MDKQTRLNLFVRDFCSFIECYYSLGVQSVNVSEVDGYVQGVIMEADGGMALEVWTENEEVTIFYGESHWHIDDYNEPCRYEEIYRAVVESVFEVIQGEVITYSAWSEGRCLGGGSQSARPEEVVTYAARTFPEATQVAVKVWGSEKKHHSLRSGDA